MNYHDSINLLTSSNKFQVKLGLERIRKILFLLGNPQEKFEVIQVAGTNGKGSVCAILSNILKCSGYKTGLYTSPHILEYTERVQINGVQISKEDFANLIQEICTLADSNNIDLTEFEILTACALKYFADKKIEIAVIETGLGGRFDATNVFQSPLCSIITSISLDHTDKLGDTVEKIAFEKAGIIKKGSFAIVHAKNCGYQIIKEQAEKMKATLVSVEKDIEILFENGINYAVLNDKKYEFPLLGLYQKENLAIVIAAVELLKQKGFNISLKEGLQTVKWRARLEYNKKINLLIDGAHNPSGAKELKNSINYYFNDQKKIFIYGTINTKDYKTIANILFQPDDEVYYYNFKHKNAVSIEEYKETVTFLPNIKPYTPDVLKRKELKILTGSFYMIGEFLNAMKAMLQ